MKNIFSLFCIAVLLFSLNSCSKNSTEPGVDDENVQPGRRDYTWTIDTIKSMRANTKGIWGFSPNDVYSVGMTTGAQIWRFNGTKWHEEDRAIINFPMDLVGFSNKMWVCSLQGEIWRYADGAYAKELDTRLLANGPFSFYSIGGSSENEIFASSYSVNQQGVNGILFKYNGSTWSLYKTFENIGQISNLKYSSRNGKYYFRTGQQVASGNALNKVYEFDGNDIKLIYEQELEFSKPISIKIIQGSVYITVGKKIFRYINNNMELLLEVNNTNFSDQLGGRNNKDILLEMSDGIAHYNGTDYQYLFKTQPEVVFTKQAMVFEKDIFIPAQNRTSGYQLIYHGVLR